MRETGEEPFIEHFEDWARQASDLDWLSWGKEMELADEAVYLRSIETLDPADAWNDLKLRGDYLTLMRPRPSERGVRRRRCGGGHRPSEDEPHYGRD